MEDKKIKVLLVEDDPSLLGTYSDELKNGGFDLDVAIDESEGFKKAIENKPDVVLLDISLPEKEDFGLLKLIRANKSADGISVLILSDLVNEDEISEALSAGAQGYLVRSQIVFQEVIDKIKKLVKRA